VKRLTNTIIALCLFCSCSKEEQAIKVIPEPVIQISYGLICGWGSYDDSLFVSGDSLFLKESRSGNPSHSFDTAMVIPNHWKQSIRDSLNWNAFTDLKYRNGTLGGDGCDCWLKIKNDTAFHEIWYIPWEDELHTIEPLLSQLDSLWVQYGSVPSPLTSR